MRRPAANAPSLESQDSGPKLADKLREHYRNRDFSTQPHHLHRVGMLSYLYCVLAVPAITLLFILPNFDISTGQWLFMSAAAVFLAAESLANFRACIQTHHSRDLVHCSHCNSTNGRVARREDAADVDGNWRHCVQCQRPAPPRSHHCKVCRACVLRRDHHCYFTACCVGHHSQKHFLVLCVYNIVGLAYGSACCCAHVLATGHSVADLLLPVTALHLLQGSASLFALLLVCSLYLQLACLGLACLYLFLETVLVLRGQTFHEMGKMIRRYNLGWYENVTSALGPWYCWPLLLLFPFDSQQTSDGCNWRVRKLH